MDGEKTQSLGLRMALVAWRAVVSVGAGLAFTAVMIFTATRVHLPVLWVFLWPGILFGAIYGRFFGSPPSGAGWFPGLGEAIFAGLVGNALFYAVVFYVVYRVWLGKRPICEGDNG